MRTGRRFTSVAIAALFVACVARPTQVTTDWRDPGAQPLRFRRIAAFFAGEDATLRRQAEDRLAARLQNTVASWTIVPDSQLAAADTQTIRTALANAGVDGVIVLRLVDVASQSSGVPTATSGSPSEHLWAYLRRTPRSALTPGQQTVITMESRVYSIPAGRLLWAGHSRSFNPVSLRELVNMIVDASAAELQRQGM